jgi:hypothetical protein
LFPVRYCRQPYPAGLEIFVERPQHQHPHIGSWLERVDVSAFRVKIPVYLVADNSIIEADSCQIGFPAPYPAAQYRSAAVFERGENLGTRPGLITISPDYLRDSGGSERDATLLRVCYVAQNWIRSGLKDDPVATAGGAITSEPEDISQSAPKDVLCKRSHRQTAHNQTGV